MSDRIVPAPDGSAERFLPPVSPAAEPFWEATRARRLVVQWCTDCDVAIHYPREACPRCLGSALAFRPASGRATVYALSVMPVPANPTMAGREPYPVVLVELDEGPRLLSNLVGEGALAAAVGDTVEVAWEPLPDGRHLPVFVLV
jgi:uncharacterized OB-fold protein